MHVCLALSVNTGKRAKTSDDSIPLPDPFPFPKHYSRGLEQAFKNGQLPRMERRPFLSDIAAAMLCYKQYPSRDGYVLFSCAVCKEFPLLNIWETVCKYLCFFCYISILVNTPCCPVAFKKILCSERHSR